jgi:chromosome segregation ATPase
MRRWYQSLNRVKYRKILGMFENILEFLLVNQVETTILIIVGLLLGALISWLYWKPQVSKREHHIGDLETTVEEKDEDLKEMRGRAQELVNEKDKEIESLNVELGQKEENIQHMTQQIDEKNKSIDTLKKEVADLEQKNRDSVTRAEDAEATVEEQEKTLEEKAQEITDLEQKNQESVSRAEGAEEKVEELGNSLEEKEQEIIDLEQKNQDTVTRAEAAETRGEELERSLEEKEQEVDTLRARMRVMQDDFSCLVGIGPKVSSVLRSAGINTFAKLASADVDKLTEILEAANPSLLRLTDPSTWPDQARLASEENWKGLKELQDSLKGSRRA